ncbi:MAG TPA: sugar phosphate nucleotidyltransferase [Stellaceae bacterium]|nr:sugar phosphate nucleotidyltransferase [Stellaceae bacterium]
MAVSEPLPALALLAGGLATRLRPITATIPKSMVEVAGAPFIAHQLRLLARERIGDIVVCAGFLGAQIEAFLGDGAAFGCRVRYSRDGDKLLGTGGALRRALPLLGERFLVMYGDSYLDTDFAAVDRAFRRSGKPALMTVFRNEGRWDTSNVEFADEVIRRYDKTNRTPAMRHIDWGLGMFDAAAIRTRPDSEAFDLADLYRDLAAQGRLAGFEVHQRFYEIGSPAGLEEAGEFLRRAHPLAGETR